MLGGGRWLWSTSFVPLFRCRRLGAVARWSVTPGQPRFADGHRAFHWQLLGCRAGNWLQRSQLARVHCGSRKRYHRSNLDAGSQMYRRRRCAVCRFQPRFSQTLRTACFFHWQNLGDAATTYQVCQHALLVRAQLQRVPRRFAGPANAAVAGQSQRSGRVLERLGAAPHGHALGDASVAAQ